MTTARPFPVPANEPLRLLSLAEARLLEDSLSPNVDRICDLARTLLHAPAAMLSLLDGDTQWLKAAHGPALIPACSPRGSSICTYTILQDEPLVVEDLLQDPRFRDSPLVGPGKDLRFYAGVPVAAEPGVPLGALCVLDTVPRSLPPAQVGQLASLAAMVSSELRLHATARRLDAANRRFAALIEASVTMVWRMQTDGTLCEITTQHAFAGADPDAYLGFAYYEQMHPEDRPVAEASLKSCLAGDAPCEWTIRLRTPAGAYRWVQVKCIPVPGFDGAVAEWIGSCTDVHDRRLAEEAAWHAAHHDHLTGLGNRKLFQRRLDEALAKAGPAGRGVHLLMVDLDNFKDINDTSGHDAGDALLQHVSRELLDCVGTDGTVARLGGDEFGVVLTGVRSQEDGLLVAERILRGIERPLSHGHRPLACHASVGVARFPDHGATPADLLKSADIALYAAKGAGRNRFAAFEDGMREQTETRVQVGLDIVAALGGDQVVPFYQPRVCLETGRVTGFEALARWLHPGKGILMPGAFASALEDPELSLLIGDRMVGRVLRDIGGWLGKGHEIGRVAVNFSTAQFARDGLARRLVAALDRNGVPASSLEVEVTETVFLNRSSANVARTLSELHAAGISIALDDFGTGFASLTHLKQFPVDTIKIDRSFVGDIERTPHDAAIVSAVAGLARTLGMTVVAEGVETAAQARSVKARGCHEGQGYLYAAAMPADAVIPFLASRPAPAHPPPRRAAAG